MSFDLLFSAKQVECYVKKAQVNAHVTTSHYFPTCDFAGLTSGL